MTRLPAICCPFSERWWYRRQLSTFWWSLAREEQCSPSGMQLFRNKMQAKKKRAKQWRHRRIQENHDKHWPQTYYSEVICSAFLLICLFIRVRVPSVAHWPISGLLWCHVTTECTPLWPLVTVILASSTELCCCSSRLSCQFSRKIKIQFNESMDNTVSSSLGIHYYDQLFLKNLSVEPTPSVGEYLRQNRLVRDVQFECLYAWNIFKLWTQEKRKEGAVGPKKKFTGPVLFVGT